MSEYKIKYIEGGRLIGNREITIIEADNGKEAMKICREECPENRNYSFEITDIEKL